MVGKEVLHYRIIEEVGRGGMGIVYKARDTRLDRDVALKFLPPHLSASPQDKARFIQEAKAAATLDHPNICTVYSIEEFEGQLFFAMQLVDGQLLRDRISGLSEKQAIDIGIQIAEGLAAAHEKGIVHRDIKPENIMIRKDGIVQIMDFGLAKLKGVSRLTKEGSTVGTAGYMSPEQVQGQDADHRSDIFSLGVLLHELLTGELPFKGVHETAVAYEIVNVDAPPVSSSRTDVTPALDAIVLECLEKDPRERTQSASQIAVDLRRYRRESSRQRLSMEVPAIRPSTVQTGAGDESGDAVPVHTTRRLPQWAVSAAIGALMLGAGYGLSFLTTGDSTPLPLVRATVDLPDGIRYWDALGGHSAISPDGTLIVFVGSDSASQRSLWVRPLNSHAARQIAGTTNPSYPFWSPEGTSIGFFADGKLKTIDAAGGPAIVLADAPFGRGGAWGKNGDIIFSPSVSDPNLYAVSASGGSRRTVTAFDSTKAPRFPFFLSDGVRFVFSQLEGEQKTIPSLRIGSLGDPQTSLLLEDACYGIVSSGTILYLRQGILMAQRFDESSNALVGRPVSVEGNVNVWMPRAKGDYSVSRNGILLHAGGTTARDDEVIWIGEDGNETTIVRAKVFGRPMLSPDGTRVAYDETETQQDIHLWVYDLVKKTKTRITFASRSASSPCWSRDGKTLYFNMEDAGSKAVIGAKRADGSGTLEIIARGDQSLSAGYYPFAVTPDGRRLLLLIEDESASELGYIDLRDGALPHPITRLDIKGPGQARDRNPVSLSPDGKWIAYESNELGSNSIFVTALDGQSGRWQVSPGNAMSPMWVKGGIVYYSMDANRNERVDFSAAGGTPTFSPPRPVFPPGKAANNMLYGAAVDGRRYVGLRRLNAGSGSSLYLVVNWQALMARE